MAEMLLQGLQGSARNAMKFPPCSLPTRPGVEPLREQASGPWAGGWEMALAPFLLPQPEPQTSWLKQRHWTWRWLGGQWGWQIEELWVPEDCLVRTSPVRLTSGLYKRERPWCAWAILTCTLSYASNLIPVVERVFHSREEAVRGYCMGFH